MTEGGLEFEIATSDFGAVGCEQLLLILAELKVLISEARQAHSSQRMLSSAVGWGWWWGGGAV